ncbi:hypothetical protein T484DRAFT_1866857 [Baffinella frigidus]|nr:hypothetical protein T484DRAFT_1866869 [Cryptophyta sp. CCMP2293]KAJ1465015.1 hypothetical protein T484DRAFT_1866857 [Cryptophyta sp. CCMP2293]
MAYNNSNHHQNHHHRNNGNGFSGSDDHLDRASQRFAQQLDVTAIQEHKSLMDNGFNATAEMTSLFLQSTKLVEDPDAMDFKLPQDGLVRFDRLVENVYGDFSEWEKILQMLSFEEEETTEYLRSSDSDFCNDLPTIKFFLDTLQQVGADTLSMTDSLKIYLLTNVKNVTSFVAIKAFLTSTMPATFNASDACNIFTACMADSRFTQAQFSDDLAWFMLNVIVSQDFHSKCIFFMETKESMLQCAAAGGNGNDDSLHEWALRARIPPAISHQSRLLGYVLMAQASAIIDFLRLLTVHVTPFDELIAFREQCFADFLYTDSKDLSWLNFLPLYVAAYQNEDVWPHVWKSFCTVLSHQVLIAVGNFKKQYVYAFDKVTEICMQGGEESRKAVNDVS